MWKTYSDAPILWWKRNGYLKIQWIRNRPIKWGVMAACRDIWKEKKREKAVFLFFFEVLITEPTNEREREREREKAMCVNEMLTFVNHFNYLFICLFCWANNGTHPPLCPSPPLKAMLRRRRRRRGGGGGGRRKSNLLKWIYNVQTNGVSKPRNKYWWT